ncbi:MAG: hypothetical protein H6624_16455 [Bdellovibrionaceae bacterium]|nr:hypothetical protein [Bdellovibrionales bacterium]MCB9085939.1 hypothetical protein [Pseudobdellovibrionaceae bacterium]
MIYSLLVQYLRWSGKYFAPVFFVLPVLALDQDLPPGLLSKCYTCHKETGRSWVDEVPTLTGQNQTYLKNQLYAFKLDQRQDLLLYRMNGIAQSLTDEEIEIITRYYSEIDPRTYWEQPDQFASEEEERLYRLGEKHSPVCLACHAEGEKRPPVRADFPYISGQNQVVIEMQLGFFATGKRRNPMMDFIKEEPFNTLEMRKALAFYFSRQAPPPPIP